MKNLLLLISILFLGSLAYSQQTNYIPKYSGSTTTNNSVIYQKDLNIGIGTTNPLSKLQIGDSWLFSDGPIDKIIGYNTVYSYSLNVNQRIKSGAASKIFMMNSGDIGIVTAPSGAVSSTIHNTDWKGIILKNNGNVGIGTNEPMAKFQIGDNWLFSDGPIDKIIGHNTVYSYSQNVNQRIKSGGASKLYMMNTGEIGIGSAPNGTVGSTIHNTDWKGLIIKSDGNAYCNSSLAIGTTDAKGYKLAVAGNMIAEGIVCKLQGNWPDYVFDKNYNLKPLSEVEDFINKNSHLPNIPSAAEIEENGINVGDMNAILLQKIEELTLYVIEQDKQIKSLSEEVKSLKE